MWEMKDLDTFGVELVIDNFGLDVIAVDLVGDEFGLGVDGLETVGDGYHENDKAFVFAVTSLACKASQS